MCPVHSFVLLLIDVIRASSGTVQPGVQSGSQDVKAEPVYSIFPVENEEFVYGAWEEKVILDDQVCWDFSVPNTGYKPMVVQRQF